ncbi:MAG: PAS domain S-box protein [Kovacikia sp.]
MRLNWLNRHSLLAAGAIAIACFLAANLAADSLNLGVKASPVWPPAGIALASLLLYGRQMWLGIGLGMLLFAFSLGVSWSVAGVAAAGSTLGAIAGNELLHRIKFRLSLGSLRDVLGFIALAVLLSPSINATISSFNACFAGIEPWGNFGAHWGTIWLGDGIGILVVTPLLLTWLGKPLPGQLSLQWFWQKWQQNLEFRQKAIEIFIWAILLVSVSWIVFQSPTQTEIAHFPLEYLPFPLIFWAALRLGQRGTVLGSLIVSGIAISGVVRHGGPFLAKTNGSVWQAIFSLQAFVGIITITALVLAAAVAERQQAVDHLLKSKEHFRSMFEGAGIGIGLNDLKGKIVESNPVLQRMLAYNREELSSMTFAEFTYPEDLAADKEGLSEMLAGQRHLYQLEKRFICKDGQLVWVRQTNSLVRDEMGEPLFIVGMVEDITELKRAEESIQLYANIVKSMQMGLIVWQLENLNDLTSFRLMDINPAARQILSLTADPQKLIGQRMVEVFPGLLETAFPGIYAMVIRSGKVRDLGEICYGDTFLPEGVYATKAFPLPNQCVGLVFEDITDRKQAEEALQQSEARFRVVAETAACAFLLYQGSRLRYVNPAAQAITGYSRDELLSIDFWNLAHPEFRDLIQKRGLERQQGKALPTRYEVKILTKSGQERWVDLTAGVVTFEGKPAGLATAYDITDRKQAEAKLLMSANRERLMVEIASRIRSSLNLEEILQTTVEEIRKFLQTDRVFISYFDEAGGCQAISESVAPQWTSILGWEPEIDTIQEIKSTFQPGRVNVVNDSKEIEKTPLMRECSHRSNFRAGMGIGLRLNGQMFGVLIAQQCSGPRQWQSFEIGLMEQLATQVEIAIQQGQLYRQVQTFASKLEGQVGERTAELHQRMKELQNLNQVKDLLLHAVSHDLRTPVQGMLMVLNRLRSKCNDSEMVPVSRSMLNLMIQSSDHQLYLLNSLRENQISNEPEVRLTCQPVHLDQVWQTALESLQPLLNTNRATLISQIPADLPSVNADPTQLQGALEELLSNALKHNPPDLTLTLSASILTLADLPTVPPPPTSPPPIPMLRCAVTDNGNGMNQATCDRLFKPYVRSLDNPNRTGIGLGLYRCHQIITAHRGQIGVLSQPGSGATFWFTLPLAGGEEG